MNAVKLKAWLCLKSAPELSLRASLELLKRYPDPCEFVGQPEHEIYVSGSLKTATADYLSQATLPPSTAHALGLMNHHQIKYLCYSDADYPPTLKAIVDPPLILYYRGDLLSSLLSICLGVVGTRKPSAYGNEMCRKLLLPICERGVTIVSGLASG
ncbi:MAG: DNA-processing protein DprA, partial [Candidatus Cloacimonas sp.]|nr:DNA-processing protein DprA [Candidatus Cloacimonas sp.]